MGIYYNKTEKIEEDVKYNVIIPKKSFLILRIISLCVILFFLLIIIMTKSFSFNNKIIFIVLVVISSIIELWGKIEYSYYLRNHAPSEIIIKGNKDYFNPYKAITNPTELWIKQDINLQKVKDNRKRNISYAFIVFGLSFCIILPLLLNQYLIVGYYQLITWIVSIIIGIILIKQENKGLNELKKEGKPIY